MSVKLPLSIIFFYIKVDDNHGSDYSITMRHSNALNISVGEGNDLAGPLLLWCRCPARVAWA